MQETRAELIRSSREEHVAGAILEGLEKALVLWQQSGNAERAARCKLRMGKIALGLGKLANARGLVGSACDTFKGGDVTFSAEFPCGAIIVVE